MTAASCAGAPQTNRYAVSLAWTALTPGTTADAIFALDRATNWSDFRKAAALFSVPSQNLVYADTAGHIGYQAPGKIPVRRSATPGAPPGFWPAPGWDSQWDWKGYVPFDEMPNAFDPAEGFIVTANQAVTASPTPVPHLGVGLRLPGPAHPHAARLDPEGLGRDDVADPG